ncbi:MAG: hypothetical protein ACREE6_16720, partial [Limisphaerales bacterium]
MRRFLTLLLAIAGTILFQVKVMAWDGAGHMAIAAEAFGQLSPELEAQAIEVLKAHPDYQQWAQAYHPNPTVSLGAYI